MPGNSSSNNFNRRSLFSPTQEEYDFSNAEKVQRTNSLKLKPKPLSPFSSPSSSNHHKEVEPDSISEIALRIPRRLQAFTFRRKQRSNSLNINPADLEDNILNFDGVLFYLTSSNGLVGSLKVTSEKLFFTSGLVELRNNKLNKHNFFNQPYPKNPFREKENSHVEIDLINIAEISRGSYNERRVIHLHYRNFKNFKISLRESSAESLYNRLLIGQQPNSSRNRPSFLWEYLYDSYRYRVRSDWMKYETWYKENYKIRFSQFNEVIGMCHTLPEMIIVPKKVEDSELGSIVNLSDGQRVPIITYMHRESRNMIIRSTTFNSNRLNLKKLFKGDIFSESYIPLEEFDINSILPSLEEVEKINSKFRKACYKVVSMHQDTDNIQILYNIDYSNKFWSKCGFWLNLLSKVLELTSQMVITVRRKASIGLIEKNDRYWNCLLSSLVQICIDPDKRTIRGFEPMLSKEWLYMSGYKRSETVLGEKIRGHNKPNDMLFLLFLDAVHQLIIQNPCSFEFSTSYLIFLLDNQIISELLTKDRIREFNINKDHLLIKNPYFSPNHTILKIKTHVTHMRFFTQLYFRSLSSNIKNLYTIEELLYIEELENRKLI